jgi:hypothetical protein
MTVREQSRKTPETLVQFSNVILAQPQTVVNERPANSPLTFYTQLAYPKLLPTMLIIHVVDFTALGFVPGKKSD